MQIGYLADLFDLLNVRDLDIIEQAKEGCELLIVGVFTDEYAQQLLGYTPVVPFEERLELVSHVRGLTDVRAHDPHSVDASWQLFRLTDRNQSDEAGVGLWLEPRRVTGSDVLTKALNFPDRSVA